MTRQLVVSAIQSPAICVGRKGDWGDYLQSTGEPQRLQGLQGAPLKLTSCPQHSVQQADLPGRVLSLSVWHRESLGRNIFLGEVEVPLDTWNWDSEATWLPLQPRVRAGV